MKIRHLILIGTAVIGTAAHGQDFTGPSIGVQGGWTKTDVQNPKTELGIVPADKTKDSAVLGGFVGYDHEIIPKVVLGAQADLNFAIDDDFNAGTAMTRVTINPERSIDLTARAGYLVTPETLIYLRGGYTNNRVKTTTISGNVTKSATEDRDGWIVGGGVERIVWRSISVRGEYRYSDLSDGPGKFDRHQLMLGVAYRF